MINDFPSYVANLIRFDNHTAQLSIEHDVSLIKEETATLSLQLRWVTWCPANTIQTFFPFSGTLDQNVSVTFHADHVGYIQIIPESVVIEPQNGTWHQSILVRAFKPAQIEVVGKVEPFDVVKFVLKNWFNAIVSNFISTALTISSLEWLLENIEL